MKEENSWLLVPMFLLEGGEPDYYSEFASTASTAYSAHLERDDFDDYYAADLPGFLGDAFSAEEIKLILSKLLIGAVFREGQLRAILKLNLGQKKPNDLSRFDKASCIQMILLATDQEVIAAIDECIFSGEITIPQSEIREVVAAPQPGTWQRNECQCSPLGFRVKTHHSFTNPLARLTRLILNLYNTPKERDSLGWLLRNTSGKSLGQKIESLIRDGDVRSTVRQFVFASLENLENAMSEVGASHFQRPAAQPDEEVFLNRLLWKLGFSIYNYDQVSSRLRSRTKELRAATHGKNTLFPLVTGFRALATVITRLLETDPADFQRGSELIPEYAKASTLQDYPFRHRHFALDLDRLDVEAIASDLVEISRLLEKAAVMSIRNAFDHRSESFPSKEEIRTCCDLLEEVVTLCEERGYIPVVYTMESIRTDAFGRSEIVSRGVEGIELKWYQSPSLHCANHERPGPREPQVLVPSVTMPRTGEIFRCGIRERSEYTAMWSDYPKRKYIRREEIFASRPDADVLDSKDASSYIQ